MEGPCLLVNCQKHKIILPVNRKITELQPKSWIISRCCDDDHMLSALIDSFFIHYEELPIPFTTGISKHIQIGNYRYKVNTMSDLHIINTIAGIKNIYKDYAKSMSMYVKDEEGVSDYLIDNCEWIKFFYGLLKKRNFRLKKKTVAHSNERALILDDLDE